MFSSSRSFISKYRNSNSPLPTYILSVKKNQNNYYSSTQWIETRNIRYHSTIATPLSSDSATSSSGISSNRARNSSPPLDENSWEAIIAKAQANAWFKPKKTTPAAAEHHEELHEGEHHSHPLFNPPYRTGPPTFILGFILIGGLAAVMGPVTYQQYKGGFWFKKKEKKEEEKKH